MWSYILVEKFEHWIGSYLKSGDRINNSFKELACKSKDKWDANQKGEQTLKEYISCYLVKLGYNWKYGLLPIANWN